MGSLSDRESRKSGRRRRGRERRRIFVCLGLSLTLHLLAGVLWVARELPPPAPEEFPVRKFVKQLPPSRRTLARRQLPEAIQRPLIRRPAARATPAVAVAPAPLTTQRQGLPGIPIPLVAAPPPPAEIPVQPLAHLPAPRIGPQFQAGALHGTRTGADEIDLSLELLDVDALDTGRHRALVVVDPQDRRNLKGFLYLSSIYSESIERAELESPVPRRQGFIQADPRRQVGEREALQGLADKMSERTGVRTQVRDGISLDDPQLLQAPFLLLTINCPFSFTDAEARNLGKYLLSGGFLYAEVVRPRRQGSPGLEDDVDLDIPSLRSFLRAAFREVGYREGKDWAFARLEPEHPLFHCYYDIGTLPRGFRDMWFWYWSAESKAEPTPPYLEGIAMGDRLVGLYSLKNYADFWAGLAEKIRDDNKAMNYLGVFDIGGEELKPYDLGINILVYALTREGSLAQRLVAVE